MIHVYPVTKTDLNVCAYHVRINGQPVSLNTARVSAEPFNRRWPGHQRSEEQTELINFLSMAADEPLHFEIVPERPFESAVIRPLSLGIQPEIRENGVIAFTLEHPACFTLEPYGRHDALHIFVDAPAEEMPNPADEGVIYFGAGEHDAGIITLHSHQTLFIDEGAVVYGCVRAIDAEDIKILGRGILDNSRNREKILYECHAEGNFAAVNNATREHTVQLEYCTNVDISGITLRDSLVYNIRPIGCRKLHIAQVKIIGCWRYNSDGIDMHNCEDVLIENCFLRTFDDSICVKGFDCYYAGDVEKAVHEAMYRNSQAYDVFKNVVVRGCVIWNDWGKCLEIGAETRAEEISNVVFEDCHIIHVCATVLDVCNIDYADVHDIVFQSITVEYDDEIPTPVIQNRDSEVYINPDPDFAPCLFGAVTDYHPEYSAGGTRRGYTHAIVYRSIALFGRQAPKAHFKGYDREHRTWDVLIENLIWNGQRVTDFDDQRFVQGEFTDSIVCR